MNVCSLCLVLSKKVSDKTTKAVMKSAKKSKSKAVAGGKDGKTLDTDSETEGVAIDNFRDQIAALLSFKEAMCTEKCNLALTNAFREFWIKEQQETNDDTKMCVAVCFSYYRRMLAIAAHPEHSSASEIVSSKLIHDRYIVQLRVSIQKSSFKISFIIS